MANVKYLNDILIGSGRMFLDGNDVGQLQGDVTFTDSTENYELKAGFPQTTIITVPTSETLKLSCNLLETNLDVIKTADYLIDIGPEGGMRGGTVIAKGTPEEVAENPASYTGYYVKKMLKS